jgi:hypothetical protein
MRTALGLLTIFVVATAHDARAQAVAPAWRAPWTLQAGAFLADSDTRARAALAGEVEGTEIVFDSSLGLTTSRTTPLLSAQWRPGARHQLGLTHFGIARGGSAILSGQVRYAGETFAAGTRVDSRFRTEILGAEYAYALLQTAKGEFTLGLGAHHIQLEAALSSAQLGAYAAESAELLAPTLRLGGSLSLAPRWSVHVHGHAFRTRRDEYRIRLYSAAAAAHYHAWTRAAVTLGYRRFDLSLDVERPDWIGAARTTFRGPVLGVAAYF